MFTDNSSTSANPLGPVLPEDLRCSLKLLIDTMDTTPTNSLCDEQSACCLEIDSVARTVRLTRHTPYVPIVDRHLASLRLRGPMLCSELAAALRAPRTSLLMAQLQDCLRKPLPHNPCEAEMEAYRCNKVARTLQCHLEWLVINEEIMVHARAASLAARTGHVA